MVAWPGVAAPRADGVVVCRRRAPWCALTLGLGRLHEVAVLAWSSTAGADREGRSSWCLPPAVRVILDMPVCAVVGASSTAAAAGCRQAWRLVDFAGGALPGAVAVSERFACTRLQYRAEMTCPGMFSTSRFRPGWWLLPAGFGALWVWCGTG